MSELSDADLVWNRALFGGVAAVRAGDNALAALLRFHGMAMNGGVLYAVECLSPVERDAAASGYAYFGLPDVAVIMTDALSLIETGGDLDTAEAEFDNSYRAVIPDDSALFDRFLARLESNPSEFAPL